MKKLTRRSFLKVAGLGASVAALQNIPAVTALADDGMVEIDMDALVAEINDWYQASGESISIEIMEYGNCRMKASDAESLIETLQSIQFITTDGVDEDINRVETEPQTVTPHEIMPVNFTRTEVQEITVILRDLVSGTVGVEITVDATIDALRGYIMSASGSACEDYSANLDTISIDSVTVVKNSPADGDVSYSVPCDAIFEWTEPITNFKFRTHKEKTLTGYVSY